MVTKNNKEEDGLESIIESIIESNLESNLSFTELGLYTSYICEWKIGERKLKKPSYYIEKTREIAEKIKEVVKEKKKDYETVIKKYIKSLEYKEDISGLPTYTLESREANCVSATFLHLALSEMLTEKRNKQYKIGVLLRKRVGRSNERKIRAHVVVIKDPINEIIDMGNSFALESYLKSDYELLFIRPKKSIIGAMLINCGGYLGEKGKIEEMIECYKKALLLDTKYEELIFSAMRNILNSL